MSSLPLVILMPVYDDWESVRLLLPHIDDALASYELRARILLIDDGSRHPAAADLAGPHLRSIDEVAVLVLRRNLGHQRALCIGICQIASGRDWANAEGVIIMDADGEDSPGDIPRMVRRFREGGGRDAIFAQRLRRSEGPIFRLFYRLFRALHRVFSGVPVQIGNFSMLPLSAVSRLSVVAELWNHYAAACVHARIPIVMLPTKRGHRLAGTSRMNFVGLVGHGLAAISVFGERIGARSLIAVTLVACVLTVAGALALGFVLFTPFEVPRWAPLAAALSTLILMQALLLSLLFSFLTLSARAGGHFIPARDYSWFVERVDTIWKAHERV
jgi:polyisoprenyl-phosphate glycosyltransferase